MHIYFTKMLPDDYISILQKCYLMNIYLFYFKDISSGTMGHKECLRASCNHAYPSLNTLFERQSPRDVCGWC